MDPFSNNVEVFWFFWIFFQKSWGWKMYEHVTFGAQGTPFYSWNILEYFPGLSLPIPKGPTTIHLYGLCFFSLRRWSLGFLHVQLRRLLKGKDTKKDGKDAKKKEPKSKETGWTSGAGIFR